MLKKIICIAVLAALVALALTSCGLSVITLTGEMKEISETGDKPVSGMTVDIKRLTFIGNDNVSIKIGYAEIPSVRIKYQESLEYSGLYCDIDEDKIEVGTTVNNNFRADEFELEIYCDFDKILLSGGYEITVDAANTRELELDVSGAVNIKMDDIDMDKLGIDIEGAASVELEGKVSEFSLDTSGAGRVNAKSLSCERVHIAASGACTIDISVSESLNVEVSGLGAITYYGSPEVTKNISGAATVKQGSEPEVEHKAGLGVDLSKNPIDSFCSRYCLEYTASNADMTAYELAKRDLWLAEVENAYRLAKESINVNYSSDDQKEYAEMLDDALDSFLAYAQNGARVEALAAMTNVFSFDKEYYGVSAGSGLGGANMQILAKIYRAEASRMYGAIDLIYDWDDADEAFAFDEDEFLSTVTEDYGIVLVPGNADGQ